MPYKHFLIVPLAIIATLGLMATLTVAEPEEKESDWSIDQPVEEVPDQALSGSVYGNDVDDFSVRVSKSAITIKSKEKIGSWPAWEVIIFVRHEDLTEPIVVTPASEDNVPHIHMKVGMEGRKFAGTLMYVDMYAMRLEPIKDEAGKTSSFALHLSLPDYHHTHLIGRIEDSK